MFLQAIHQACIQTLQMALLSSVCTRSTSLHHQMSVDNFEQSINRLKLGVGMDRLDLHKLVLVVERHHLDTMVIGELDVAHRLAWMSVNDFLWIDSKRQHGAHFDETGAVKASAKRGERLDNHGVAVAFHGVERLDAVEVLQPGLMLAVNVADVEEEEGLVIDRSRCKSLQSITDRYVVR